MTTEENEAIIKRFVEVAFNQGNVSICDDALAENFRYHGPMGEERRGPEAFKQHIQNLRDAFPDMKMTLIDIVSEGDMVFHRWSFSGTNLGSMMGNPPTKQLVTFPVWVLSHVAYGKEMEAWEMYDTLSMAEKTGSMTAEPQHA